MRPVCAPVRLGRGQEVSEHGACSGNRPSKVELPRTADRTYQNKVQTQGAERLPLKCVLLKCYIITRQTKTNRRANAKAFMSPKPGGWSCSLQHPYSILGFPLQVWLLHFCSSFLPQLGGRRRWARLESWLAVFLAWLWPLPPPG